MILRADWRVRDEPILGNTTSLRLVKPVKLILRIRTVILSKMCASQCIDTNKKRDSLA